MEEGRLYNVKLRFPDLFPPKEERTPQWFLAWFWAAQVPPAIALYFVLDFETFVKVFTLYTAVLSQLALVATYRGAHIARRTRVQVEESS